MATAGAKQGLSEADGRLLCLWCRGHDDDICCLALAPDRKVAASGQLGRDATVLVSVWQGTLMIPMHPSIFLPAVPALSAVFKWPALNDE
jgi:hypothetical protein